MGRSDNKDKKTSEKNEPSDKKVWKEKKTLMQPPRRAAQSEPASSWGALQPLPVDVFRGGGCGDGDVLTDLEKRQWQQRR